MNNCQFKPSSQFPFICSRMNLTIGNTGFLNKCLNNNKTAVCFIFRMKIK